MGMSLLKIANTGPIILSFVSCLSVPYFPKLSLKRHDFMKNFFEPSMCVLIVSTTLVRNFSF